MGFLGQESLEKGSGNKVRVREVESLGWGGVYQFFGVVKIKYYKFRGFR